MNVCTVPQRNITSKVHILRTITLQWVHESNFRSKVPNKITISVLSVLGRSLMWSTCTPGVHCLLFTLQTDLTSLTVPFNSLHTYIYIQIIPNFCTKNTFTHVNAILMLDDAEKCWVVWDKQRNKNQPPTTSA